MASLGDQRWRETLADVKRTGDGALATFDGPARAVRCGQVIHSEMRQLGITVVSA